MANLQLPEEQEEPVASFLGVQLPTNKNDDGEGFVLYWGLGKVQYSVTCGLKCCFGWSRLGALDSMYTRPKNETNMHNVKVPIEPRKENKL